MNLKMLVVDKPLPKRQHEKCSYGITHIQSEVLGYIIDRIRGGLPPTHREISTRFKWSSNAAAKCHILALEKKLFIHTEARISRAINLLPNAIKWDEEGRQFIAITRSGDGGGE